MVKALYGGSFDALHLGHLSVVELAAESFDAVYVVVLANPDKTSGMFSRAQRAALVSDSTRHLPNVNVHQYYGLVVDAAAELGADALLRSAHKESQHERAMAATNEHLTGIQTSLVTPDPRTAWISSSMVCELATAGRLEDLTTMVPTPVHAALNQPSATR